MIGATAGSAGTLTLAPHPTSAKAARRHVTQVLEAGPLSELVDTVSLLVSEVVTNAVLHAATEIELSCRIERGRVRVEVRDHSILTPSRRHYDAAATTGRGLGLVELLADEWGVETDEGGKTVWFLLAGPDAEPADRGAEPAPEAAPEVESAPATASFDVHLLALPTDLLIATIQYGDAVLRELVLLSIGSHVDGDSVRPTSRIDIGPLLARVEQAQAEGAGSVDLVLPFAADAGPAALERLALVDEADRMARDGNLLIAPAVPEIGLCRRWLMSQISLQAGGAAPVAWSMPEPMEPVLDAAHLPDAERRHLDAMTQGAIVADDANRILYVNAAAAARLGWEREDLVGRRLLTIIPPDLRAAHLAGFTRYLLTGKANILAQRVQLRALRRDGTETGIDITIEMVNLGDRQVFRATLW